MYHKKLWVVAGLVILFIIITAIGINSYKTKQQAAQRLAIEKQRQIEAEQQANAQKTRLAKEKQQQQIVSKVRVGSLPEDLKQVRNAAYASLSGLASGSSEAQAHQKAWVSKLGLPLEVESRKVGIKLRLIPPGTFTMGSSISEREEYVRSDRKLKNYKNDKQHRVTLTQPFYCGKFEVTQRQWKRVMVSNPSKFTGAGDDAPVEHVSLDDCRKFLDKLCELEGVPKGTYRLLTEAQWEYACRAGTITSLYNGKLKIVEAFMGPMINNIGWYGGE